MSKYFLYHLKGVTIMAKTKPSTAQKLRYVRHAAEMARSPKGTPLPKALIERICTLQLNNPEFNFFIGSSDSLVRNLNFFRKYRDTLELYDLNGKAKPIRLNQVFIGVSYSWKRHEAHIYAYFPFG